MREKETTTLLSRRSVVMAAAAAAPLLVMSGTGAQAKETQTAVRYQDSPKDGRQCSGCNNFLPPNSCKLVDGVISPNGWCQLWAKKATT